MTVHVLSLWLTDCDFRLCLSPFLISSIRLWIRFVNDETHSPRVDILDHGYEQQTNAEQHNTGGVRARCHTLVTCVLQDHIKHHREYIHTVSANLYGTCHVVYNFVPLSDCVLRAPDARERKENKKNVLEERVRALFLQHRTHVRLCRVVEIHRSGAYSFALVHEGLGVENGCAAIGMCCVAVVCEQHASANLMLCVEREPGWLVPYVCLCVTPQY